MPIHLKVEVEARLPQPGETPATPGARRRDGVPTREYRPYGERRPEKEAPAPAYAAAHREAQTTPSGRSTWPLVGAALQLPVKQAREGLLAPRAEQTERAEPLLARPAASAASDP